MKKLIALFGSLILATTAVATVIACGTPASLGYSIKNIDNLKLRVDIDDKLKNNYTYLSEQVDDLIGTVQPDANTAFDYGMDLDVFGADDIVIKPSRMNVFALPKSRLLSGNFNVVIYKDINKYLPKDILVEGTIEQSEAVKQQVLDKITELVPHAIRGDSFEPGVDFVLTTTTDGWSINSNEDSIININFSFKADMKSLTELTNSIDPIVVKTSMDSVEALVKDKVEALKPTAVFKQDYEIKGNTNEASVMIVKAIPGSSKLSDSFTIKVKQADISSVEINLDVLNSPTEVQNEVISKINALSPDNTVSLGVTENDFRITKPEANKPNKFLVEAKTTSKLITGKFSFELSLIPINPFTKNTVDIALNDDEPFVREYAKNWINQNLVRGDYRLAVTDNDFTLAHEPNSQQWDVIANPLSNIISGSFTLTTGVYNLTKLTNLPSTIVGTNYSLFLNDLNKKLSDASGHNLTSGLDYVIRYSENVNNDIAPTSLDHVGQITILAKNKNMLKGQTTLQVLAKNISDGALSDTDTQLTALPKINDAINNAINSLFADNTNVKVTKDDYDIFNIVTNGAQEEKILIDLANNPKTGKFKVIARNNSNLITGEFSFSVGTFSLNTIEAGTISSVLVGNSLDPSINQILEIISKNTGVEASSLVKGEDYEILDESDNSTKSGTVTFKAVEFTGALIKGSVTFNVTPRDISGLEIIQVMVLDWDKLLPAINERIQGLFTGTKITISQNDYEIVDKDGNLVTFGQITTGGNYYVRGKQTNGTLNPDSVIQGQFKIIIHPVSLTGLEEKEYKDNFDKLSVLNKPEEIKNVIISEVEKIAGPTVKIERDYEIVGGDSVLNQAGTVTIQALNTGYVKDSFSFEIKRYAPTKADFEDLITGEMYHVTSQAQAEEYVAKKLFAKTDRQEIEQGSDYIVVYNQDLTISFVPAAYSKYLAGIPLSISTTKVSLTTLEKSRLANISYPMGTSFTAIKTQILPIIDEFFTPKAGEYKPELDVDYEVLLTRHNVTYGQPNDDIWISGSDVIQIVPKAGSNYFTDSYNIEINFMQDSSGSNNHLWEAAGHNYRISANQKIFQTDSTYGDNWANLEIPRGSALNRDDILSMSRNFLVTKIGIFVGPKLVANTAGLDGKDVLAINDNYVVTTKGTWQINDLSTTDFSKWSMTKVVGLESLSREEFIFANPTLLITTKNIYIGTMSSDKKSTNLKPEPKFNEDISKWKSEFIMANDSFIVLRNGIWAKKTSGTLLGWTKLSDAVIKSDDLISKIVLENNYLYVPSVGYFTNNEKLKDDSSSSETGLQILARSNHYLVTSTGIYWDGQLVISGTYDQNSVVGISDYFLMLNNAVYYKNAQIDAVVSPIKTAFNNNYSVGDFLTASESFLVTTKGVQYKDSKDANFDGNLKLSKTSVLSKDNLFTDANGQVLGVTKRYLAIKPRIGQPGQKIWVADSTGVKLLRYFEFDYTGKRSTYDAPLLTANSEILAANDYFLIPKGSRMFGINAADNEFNQVTTGGYPSTVAPLRVKQIDSLDQLILLKGPVLLLAVPKNGGFYWFLDPYWGSDQEKDWKSLVIRVGEQGQIITKEGTWTRWNQTRSSMKLA